MTRAVRDWRNAGEPDLDQGNHRGQRNPQHHRASQRFLHRLDSAHSGLCATNIFCSV